MPRARRPWSDMRAEVRRLLRETVAADSFWADADLLDLFNQAKDLRDLMLAEQDEGWGTEVFTTALVADQVLYPLPEGSGEVTEVRFRSTAAGIVRSSPPLVRSEGFGGGRIVSGTTATGTWWWRDLPTYRLLESAIELDRPPQIVNAGDLLTIGLAGASARVVSDGDKISLRYPDLMETLLIYDTWAMALGTEEARDLEPSQPARTRLDTFHRQYERMFEQWSTTRAGGRQRARAWRLGD